MSETELEVVGALSEGLPENLVLEFGSDEISVDEGERDSFSYTPDFQLRNVDTQATVAVEVKTPVALAFATVMLLKDINAAYKERGQDFLLLVWDSEASDAVPQKNRIRDAEFQWIWARNAQQAVSGIKELFSVQRRRRESVG